MLDSEYVLNLSLRLSTTSETVLGRIEGLQAPRTERIATTIFSSLPCLRCLPAMPRRSSGTPNGGSRPGKNTKISGDRPAEPSNSGLRRRRGGRGVSPSAGSSPPSKKPSSALSSLPPKRRCCSSHTRYGLAFVGVCWLVVFAAYSTLWTSPAGQEWAARTLASRRAALLETPPADRGLWWSLRDTAVKITLDAPFFLITSAGDRRTCLRTCSSCRSC